MKDIIDNVPNQNGLTSSDTESLFCLALLKIFNSQQICAVLDEYLKLRKDSRII